MSKHRTRRTVVIVSGGLDSCGVASYWKDRKHHIYLLTFNYGQRARREIKSALEVGNLLEAKEHKVIDISFMKELYGSSNVLTDESKSMPGHFQSNVIVPIRNAVFLTIAAAHAFAIGAEVVAYGAHLTDQPYPACNSSNFRKYTIIALSRASHLAYLVSSTMPASLKASLRLLQDSHLPHCLLPSR